MALLLRLFFGFTGQGWSDTPSGGVAHTKPERGLTERRRGCDSLSGRTYQRRRRWSPRQSPAGAPTGTFGVAKVSEWVIYFEKVYDLNALERWSPLYMGIFRV